MAYKKLTSIPGPAIVLTLCALLYGTPVHGETTAGRIWLPVVVGGNHAPGPGPGSTPPASPSPAPTASPTASPSPTPSPTPGPNPNPLHQGIATYYDATGDGACMFGASPGDMLVAAMNADEYAGGAWCGAYVHVKGAKGEVTVRIVDLCPECSAGHLDLSREAFAKIDDMALGRVPITWQVVSPALGGPIAYHFKEGSNPWWTAVQVRNHRNPIAKLEYRGPGGRWVTVPRMDYNYFVQTNPGMGPGPYTFRVTDSYGHVLTDDGIAHVEGGTVNGVAQFPPGP